MWDLCDGERDMGKDGETGEDVRPALTIFESGEDKTNGGSTAYKDSRKSMLISVIW